MIPTHGKEHDKLLEQITCGDLERDDPALRAALDHCPECRDRLGGLDSVSALLARAARDQHETLAELDIDQRAPGSDLVGPFIRARLAERGRAKWLRYAAAAAVIASAGGGWWAASRVDSRPQTQMLLGDDAFQFEELREGVVALGTVTWKFDLPPGGWYEVEFLDAEGAALAPSEHLQQSVWIPSPEEEENLPDEFRLRVTAYDGFDQLVDAIYVSVARSR